MDLEHDRKDRDAGALVEAPIRVLWGAHGTVARSLDALALRRQCARQVSGGALDCGHYIAEERPAELIGEMIAFFEE